VSTEAFVLFASGSNNSVSLRAFGTLKSAVFWTMDSCGSDSSFIIWNVTFTLYQLAFVLVVQKVSCWAPRTFFSTIFWTFSSNGWLTTTCTHAGLHLANIVRIHVESIVTLDTVLFLMFINWASTGNRCVTAFASRNPPFTTVANHVVPSVALHAFFIAVDWTIFANSG